MGLDMYLNRKTFVGAQYEHRNVKGCIELEKNGKPIPIVLSRVSEIVESVGYWRKANAIHQWFVDNVQHGVDDCREYLVERGQLQTLLDTVNHQACSLKGAKWEPLANYGLGRSKKARCNYGSKSERSKGRLV